MYDTQSDITTKQYAIAYWYQFTNLFLQWDQLIYDGIK
jgi:hypothetical protein